MTHLRTLAVAVVAAVALTAVAGAGSAAAATTLCKTNVNPCPAGNIYGVGIGTAMSLEAGQKAIFEFAAFKAECGKSEIVAIYEHNSVGGNPTGKVGKFTFEECGGCAVKVMAKGSIEFTTEGVVANGNGVLNGSGMELTVQCGLAACIVTTEATGQGLRVITGGNPAAKTTGFTTLPWKAGDSNELVCGKKPKWAGNYEFTAPQPLFIE
jgi:hypothetical protein